MTKKQAEDLFSPAALTLPAHAATGNNMLAFERSRELSKAERKSAEEFHKQLLVIEEQRRKTVEAQWALGRIRDTEAQAFIACAESVWERKTVPGRAAGLQLYIDLFSDQTLRSAGTYIHAATNLGSERILDEVGRSLYVVTEEERKGFLKRLFGGDE